MTLCSPARTSKKSSAVRPPVAIITAAMAVVVVVVVADEAAAAAVVAAVAAAEVIVDNRVDRAVGMAHRHMVLEPGHRLPHQARRACGLHRKGSRRGHRQ